MDPAKLNSGLFWATRDKGIKLGYGGTHPGIKTAMLSDLNKEIAVILFANTLLNKRDLFRYYFKVYDERWKYARQLKREQSHSPAVTR